MGYNLFMMVEFQNVLISRIFGVFPTGFFSKATLNDLYNGF